MIKHLGEGLTPFEDCGYARYPEMPCAGENVTVRCRIDNDNALPVLTLKTAEGIREIPPVRERPGYFAFSLGCFEVPQQVSYRISTSEEETTWFTFEVVVKECISRFGSFEVPDKGIILAGLSGDVSLIVRAGINLQMTLEQNGGVNGAMEGGTLALPEGFTLDFDPRGLWTLRRSGLPICQATSYEFWRDAKGTIVKTALKMQMTCRHIMGTGERFDAVDQFGLGSNGRVVERFTQQGDQTYIPIPFFMTEQGFGWFRDSDIPAEMTFQSEVTITQETEGRLLTKDILCFGSPSSLLRQYLEKTGESVLPPEWAFGVWISANGWNSDAEVDAQLAMMKANDYPVSVMVLEQWSDERTFYRWNDNGSWADPAKTVAGLKEQGLHLVLWQIPIIKHEWDGAPGTALDADIREAIDSGYVIKSADGSPYTITDKWFHGSMMLDFTNPEAVRWWFSKRKYLLDMGVEGFKTDGGEFLFEKAARLYNGSTGCRGHNLYPGQYVRAYHAFMRENGVNGVTFSRAGYTGAQTYPIHWAGDHLSQWSELQSQLRAGISAGLSGVLFWSFDIGGFAGELPSAQLYLRATAMGCFCPVMQWHAEPRNGQFYGTYAKDYNNDRSPWNLSERLGDERLLDVACQYARLHEKLRPYLWAEAQHCAKACRPMMAHLCFDYPEDARAWATDDEYMLGRSYLVAPIVHEAEDTRNVYLPAGTWRHFFTGEIHEGNADISVTSPLEQIPVFEKLG